MEPANRKVFLDKAEGLLSEIRSGVLVHAQDGVFSNHLIAPLNSARSLRLCAAAMEDDSVVGTAEALEAWLGLLVTETGEISHTRIRSLLDQISELEVALVGLRTTAHVPALDVADFVDETFETLQVPKTAPIQEPPDAGEEEVDSELLEVFREEASELLQSIQLNLDRLAGDPNDREALWEIKRRAHTFKGAAGIVGFRTMSELAHQVEDLLEQLSGSGSADGLVKLLFEAADCLRQLSDGVSGAQLDSRIATLSQQLSAAATSNGDAPPQKSISAEPSPPAATKQPAEAAPPRKGSIVRVSRDRLDEIVHNMRDLTLSRAEFENHLSEFERQLEESRSKTLRLQSASGKFEKLTPAPPYTGVPDEPATRYATEFRQNSYELAETARDATVIDSGLGSLKSALDELFEIQKALIGNIHGRLMQLRNVEFGSITPRLQRTVRVTCDEEEKRAELVLENGSLEVDTQVIDSVMEPLMHLLKNAVVHGIENPETRRMLAKPEVGTITVSVRQDGRDLVLTVSDDGRGISFPTLVDKAVASGVVSRNDADLMTPDQLRELMFVPGLTTAEQLNLNAGRGVGMSIVRESVEATGGTISVETWPQKGTAFTLCVPMPFADTNDAKPVEQNAAQDQSSEPSVMVVDDSPSVRMLLSKTIRSRGWRVDSARNGVDALEKLGSMPELPKLILSDIEMPLMGGLEFLRAIRDDKSLRAIPLVFISSRRAPSDRENALAAGAAEYLTKPYDEHVLLALVEKLSRNGSHIQV